MMNLDKKDFQLLEILARNCRIAHTTIAQALKISKDTVSYRIKQLEENGYLSQYVLFVDARRLGFTRYHLLIRFAEVQNKEETMRNIAKHPFVMWINTFIGRYDMQINVDARDGFHFNAIREELFLLCDNKIKEYVILTHLYDFEFTQLNPLLDLDTAIPLKNDFAFSNLLYEKNFPVGQSFEPYDIDTMEVELLRRLAEEPRESLIELSRTLKIDRVTVKKKITNLIEKKILLNFGGIPNLTKLGFVTYYLLVRVAQQTPYSVLKKPFIKLRNIFYAGRMIGDYDMILYLNARTPQELNESISLFRDEIDQHILHYDLLVQDKVHHWRQYSDGIYEESKKNSINIKRLVRHLN